MMQVSLAVSMLACGSLLLGGIAHAASDGKTFYTIMGPDGMMQIVEMPAPTRRAAKSVGSMPTQQQDTAPTAPTAP
ncbi:MAG: hypothetical protein VXW65_06295, partial [Pseudomonadota bacterium]|nr:hypothetical protein [Pseudomonadota bacterium]